jgi:DNA-binding response OmpR family regulator
MATILAIEDDWTVRTVLEHTLASAGHDVDVVRGVSDARRSLADGTYDMVLLDLNLPDGNGLDLLRDIRRDQGATFPVLVLSGMRQEESVVRTRATSRDTDAHAPGAPAG